jgi:NAD(P)-dependent dehydrogenase (short-subunit alcohol dehydrogenase family)
LSASSAPSIAATTSAATSDPSAGCLEADWPSAAEAGLVEHPALLLGVDEVGGAYVEYSPVPAGEFMKPILETTVDDVRATVEFSVLGAVAAANAVIPAMLDRRSGTILFTTGGAAINPNPLRAGVGVSFAGEVAYARMLHDELRDRGVHVGHTAIGGSIAPAGDHEPDDVTELLWRHHTQRTDFQVRFGID